MLVFKLAHDALFKPGKFDNYPLVNFDYLIIMQALMVTLKQKNNAASEDSILQSLYASIYSIELEY